MWRGFFSSVRYVARSCSDKLRPNQVKYHVRNGTTMNNPATMISQMLDGRRRSGGAATPGKPFPFVGRKSFDICHLRFKHGGYHSLSLWERVRVRDLANENLNLFPVRARQSLARRKLNKHWVPR